MPNSIACLHIADIHFGMENYGYTNPKTGMNTRLEDFSKSLGQAVDHAIENQIDLALFAGDAYKRNSPSPTEQREFINHFLRLADAGIPTVMIAGNHDIPNIHGKATSIEIFRALRPDMFYVHNTRPTLENPPIIETRNGPIAVCCMPFISPSFLRNVLDVKDLSAQDAKDAFQDQIHHFIEDMPKKIPDGVPRILMAHLYAHGVRLGGYRGSPLFMDDIQVLPSTLANAGYDYVALGHIHQHQNLSPIPEIPVVYSGSVDRVDFGEADEDKGFVVAQVKRGGSTFAFHPIDTRAFIHIKAEPAPDSDITECILHEIEKERDFIEGAVVRVTYTADEREMQNFDAARITQALQAAHFRAGFFRIPREKSDQRRRKTLSAEVALSDAMNAYLDEHEEWKDDRNALLKSALEIDKHVRGMKTQEAKNAASGPPVLKEP